MSTTESLAPCGIDCAACDIYLAAQSPAAAEKLAEVWRARGAANATAEWFKCQGCHADRSQCWSGDCRIYACSTERNLDNCSQCADFPCETYQEWIGNLAHHRAAFERLVGMAVNYQCTLSEGEL